MKAVEERKEVIAKRLTGKVALVTGGARGIGEGIALRLAEEGATVVITYVKSKEKADNVVAKITEFGTQGLALKADSSDKKDNEKLVDEVVKQFGKIDILINNAGVYELGPIDTVEVEQYDRVFDTNVKGVIATTIAALKHIPDGGRIINISSGAARVSMPGASIYSATKAALDTLTRIWAQDLGKRRITVNGVAPGTTESDMFNAAIADDLKDYMVSKTALGRIGRPDDIAAAVAFLASEDGRWVTGHTIAADGGINI